MVRRVLCRMLQMNPTAWEVFLRCLQLACFFLGCALLLLVSIDSTERYARYIQSAAFQEIAQVCLLLGAILPVIVEDLQGPAQRNPPDSSGR